ncbi:MAG: hypothetical protein JNN27_00510, partial [Planctomycetes bacterium]|nr:hypothetical protein [Planctomycetota bacterium]
KREILLPRPELWPEGIDELESFQYSVNDNGYARMSAPSGQHDDIVISLALAAWHVRTRIVQVRLTCFPRRRRRFI